MKSSIVRIIGTLLLLPISCATVEAQTSITYQYDAAGNRTLRDYSSSLPRSHPNSEDEAENRMRDWNIKVGPNPTSGLLRICILGLQESDGCILSLFTLTGIQILSIPAISEQTEMDLSNQACGFYLLVISIGNTQYLHKIIRF
ncbi:MAG: T9SS type A sorting domain-containing protein [Paludibacteraceae bacterium]|nr:T9SS type A sorting domain-containing protein [Paludibacteraceae bacterium]